MTYDFIPSEYYRKFCEKNNIVFSDRERVTMLLNNPRLTLKEKLDELEKIAAESSDAELKKIIEVRVSAALGLLETICASENGCVFLVEDRGIAFDNFEAAREYCKTRRKENIYNIEKRRILLHWDGSSKFHDSSCGGVRLNADCKIVDIWDTDAVFPDKLTNCFIPFRNPFERGDIVRCCQTGKTGVVETSQKEWNDHLKRAETNKAYDFSDASLIVQFLDDDGFSHAHIQPIYLEKLPDENGVPICFDTKNNLKEDLITCVSELMRGEIQLDIFMSIFLEWREEQICKNVKSRSWRRY